MNTQMLNQIKKAAAKDAKNRKDLRYKKAMAFLIKKGFLKANADFNNYYQARMKIKDFIWAGQKVEPRILEVLPAAVARLPKAFIHDKTNDVQKLEEVVKYLIENKDYNKLFFNMPYEKIKVWMNIPLNDKRTQVSTTKKIMKSFRLTPLTIQRILHLKNKTGLSESALIEKLVAAE